MWTYIFLGILGLLVVLAIFNWSKVVAGSKRIRVFFREVALEMKKVSWPTKDQVIGSTILVGVTTLFLTLIIAVVDKIFGWMVTFIFRA